MVYLFPSILPVILGSPDFSCSNSAVPKLLANSRMRSGFVASIRPVVCAMAGGVRSAAPSKIEDTQARRMPVLNQVSVNSLIFSPFVSDRTVLKFFQLPDKILFLGWKPTSGRKRLSDTHGMSTAVSLKGCPGSAIPPKKAVSPTPSVCDASMRPNPKRKGLHGASQGAWFSCPAQSSRRHA